MTLRRQTCYNKYMHFRRIFAKLKAVFVFAVALCCAFGTPVSALSDYWMDYYTRNGIYYYDPEGVDANCSTTTTTGSNVVIIGDSITNGVNAAGEFKSRIPSATVYAKDSKQFGSASDEPIAPNSDGNPSGISILKYIIAQGELRNILVFALGTNNTGLQKTAVDEVLSLVGNKMVFFVTNYKSTDEHAYDSNNSLLREAAQNSNVGLIDWAAEASKDPAKYISTTDGYYVHPTSEGSKLFAQLITTAVGGPGTSTGGATAATSGSYTDYAGNQALTDAQIQKLEANIPIYEQAIRNTNAAQYGITWQLLAVIHYKETGLNSTSNPAKGSSQKYPQGVWQLTTYSLSHPDAFPPGPISEAEFLHQTELAITEAILPRAQNLDLTTDGGIKRLFFGYNGTADKYKEKALAMGFSQEEADWGEGSPYVMNKFDARRDPDNSDVDPNWKGIFCGDGQYCPDAYTYNYGAFTLYAILGGAALSACFGGAVSGGVEGYEQVLALLKDYEDNVKCSDYNMYCGHGSSGGPKANCVTFVQYFIDRFTKVHDLPQATGNGGWVVSNLTGTDVTTSIGLYRHTYDYSDKGFIYGGFEPRPYSVFSTYNGSTDCGSVKCGHTGIIMGVDTINNKIYVAQAGYDSSLAYFQDVNHVVYDLDKFTGGTYWYAYLENIMDYDAVAQVVGGA